MPGDCIMNPDPKACEKTLTLAALNQLLAQQEAVLGPLVAMGHDGMHTILTFDTDPPSPAQNAVIAADGPGGPAVPPNSTKVCSGTIYVASVLTDATATRPN